MNEQTRNCFEYFITQYGEKSLEQIQWQILKAYIQQGHKEPALSQILDLWQRYLDYQQCAWATASTEFKSGRSAILPQHF